MSSIEQIKSINHHLRHAIGQVSEGILILESDITQPGGPKIVFANRAAGILSGHDPKSLTGQPIGLLYDPDHLEGLIARLPRVAESAKTYQMKRDIVRKDGQRARLRWTVSSVTSSSGEPVNYTLTLRQLGRPQESIETHHDPPAHATEGLNIGRGLEISRVESLALLVGGTAHDFRNALQAILNKLTLARLSCPQESPARTHIEDAEEATTHAHSLAQKILDFTKGKESKVELIELTPMLTEVANISMMGTSVCCHVEAVANLLPVRVETLQIQQVFHNLLINACQAMPNGGVIQVEGKNLDVPAGNSLDLAPGPHAVISVRDRGVGIDPARLDSIFEPDYTTKENGTGMGLATCKAIVERHQGAITVSSRINVGTEFKVFLPASAELVPSAGSNGTDPSQQAGPAEVSRENSGRILVVDDTDSVRQSAEQLLTFLGYDTVSAADGQSAIEIYRDSAVSPEPISAVLLDMTLPGGLSGEEVKRAICQIDRNAKVIATSGYFDHEAVDSLQREGWAAVLPKPYAVEDLSSAISRATRN